MTQDFEELLERMPALAEAVNAFQSEAAQLRVLDALLGRLKGVDFDEPKSAAPQTQTGDEGDEVTVDGGGRTPSPAEQPTWVRDLIRRLPDPHLVATKGTREQQVTWALIRLTETDEEGTERNVRKVLDQQLRIAVNRTQASGLLGSLVPRYASRTRMGRSYVYRPKANALQVFSGLGEDGE